MTLPRLSLGLLLSLVFASPLAFSQRTEKKPEEAWAETDVSLGMLLHREIISQEQCSKNQKYFLACVKAMDAVASVADPSLEILPESLVGKGDFKSGKVVMSLGNGLVLSERVALTLPKQSLRERQQILRERESLVEAGLGDRYASTLFSPMNYQALVIKILNTHVSVHREALALAAGISTFLAQSEDPHSRIEPLEEFNRAGEARSFIGIGAVLEKVENNHLIVRTLEGSPSRKAGLRPGDSILAVNGEISASMDINLLISKVRGPEGTTVTLRISRKGEEKDVVLTRTAIVLENVEISVREELGQKLLVVRLRDFMSVEACQRIQEGIISRQKENPDLQGLVFDVRGNGGGLLDQGICIGGLFVGKKVIVKTKDLRSGRLYDGVSARSQITQLPMVTLIDSGSASASEIVAGAVRDYKRSWIVGQRSFGKGSVQAGQELTPSIILFRTIARFYQPNGTTNQMVGINPDFEVPLKMNATEDELFALREQDQYPNALPAAGEIWKQTRSSDIARIESCRGQQRAEADTVMETESGGEVDYQLRVAAEILACDRETQPSLGSASLR